MEIKDLDIKSIELLNETQFQSITNNGVRFFDINEITFNGIKYNDVNVLANALNIIIYKKTIEDLRFELLEKLDIKTQNSIFEGFLFDGKLFSLSISAQINWSNLLNIPEEMFPINVSTKNDDIYMLTYQKVKPFYFTALSTKNSKLQLGNDLKTLIKNALTEEDLIQIKLTI